MEIKDKNPEDADAMLEWQIERYVLGDEGLDRDAFEDRLVEEPDLAWRVAKAVDDLMVLKGAAAGLSIRDEPQAYSTAANSTSTLAADEQSKVGHVWRTLAALAAMALVCIGLAWSVSQIDSEPRYTASAQEMSEIAESWLALNPVSYEPLADESADYWAFDDDEWMDAELNSDEEEADDWLYLGGQDYFLQDSELKAES
ncbi:MAG: hypothetical protein AAGG44_12020 [Planctomycetota bacterium]